MPIFAGWSMLAGSMPILGRTWGRACRPVTGHGAGHGVRRRRRRSGRKVVLAAAAGRASHGGRAKQGPREGKVTRSSARKKGLRGGALALKDGQSGSAAPTVRRTTKTSANTLGLPLCSHLEISV